MRKVNMTVTARVMVPMILTYTVVAKANEGVPMVRIARAAIKGKVPDGVDIDDSSFEVTSVEDAEVDGDENPLVDQITEYVEDADTPAPTYLRHDITDSR